MKFIRKITPYFLITIAISTLHACKKSDTPTPTPTPVTPVETIYTVGYERSPMAWAIMLPGTGKIPPQ